MEDMCYTIRRAEAGVDESDYHTGFWSCPAPEVGTVQRDQPTC